ncbi:hypothetical protein AK830_g11021 [Neonectria ditissima]|uniref:Uncharacterized protein n=1 Tax=Neonectria ditissima TaxID=78410 RepID=A0A0P7B4D5_9HYPO|nr:hypothetical protein AK830_g11021 [Neonectria ditissima]
MATTWDLELLKKLGFASRQELSDSAHAKLKEEEDEDNAILRVASRRVYSREGCATQSEPNDVQSSSHGEADDKPNGKSAYKQYEASTRKEVDLKRDESSGVSSCVGDYGFVGNDNFVPDDENDALKAATVSKRLKKATTATSELETPAVNDTRPDTIQTKLQRQETMHISPSPTPGTTSGSSTNRKRWVFRKKRGFSEVEEVSDVITAQVDVGHKRTQTHMETKIDDLVKNINNFEQRIESTIDNIGQRMENLEEVRKKPRKTWGTAKLSGAPGWGPPLRSFLAKMPFDLKEILDNAFRPYHELLERIAAEDGDQRTRLANNPQRWLNRLFRPGLYIFDLEKEKKRYSNTENLNKRKRKREDSEVSNDDHERTELNPGLSSRLARNNILAGDISRKFGPEFSSDVYRVCDFGWSNSRGPRLRVCGQSADFLDYLHSSNFKQHVASLTNTGFPATMSSDLQTVPKPWQLVGKEKLKVLAQSDFKGGFLCDAVGLGKSLTALTAAMELRKEMLPKCGFNLIVCRSSRTVQWHDEIKKHFRKENRPSYTILDDPEYPVLELLKYDIVICSGSFLRQRYNDVMLFQAYCNAVHTPAVLVLDKVFKSPPKRARAPLHSDLYETLQKHIAVLIVDESHDAKNEDSALNMAIRSLTYKHAFLLTETPMYNNWEDLAGQAMLLPGEGPIAGKQHLRQLFGEYKNGDSSDGPRGAKCQLFTALFSALVVARPKRSLRLPGLQRKTILVDLSGQRMTILQVSRCLAVGLSLISRSMAEPGKTSASKGFALLAKAQRLAANPILVTARNTVLKMAGHASENKEDTFKATVMSAYRVFRTQQGLSSGIGIDQLSPSQFQEFKDLFRQPRCLGTMGNEVSEMDGQVDLSESEADAEENTPVPSNELDIFGEHAHRVEDYFYEGYANGPGFNPHVDTSKRDGDASDSDNSDCRLTVGSSRRGRSDANFTKEWLKLLTTRDDSAIFSPRVAAITHQVREILQAYPGEKMIIVSASVMFLDIMKEALHRHVQREASFQLQISEYNGTIESPKQRAEVVRNFNETMGRTAVLLLSATAGGTGLNLAGASHIIISEPFWTAGLEEHVIGRAHRMPQDKPVHVYKFLAELSDIDMYLHKSVAKKRAFSGVVNPWFIRADEDEFIMPQLPSRAELQTEA